MKNINAVKEDKYDVICFRQIHLRKIAVPCMHSYELL